LGTTGKKNKNNRETDSRIIGDGWIAPIALSLGLIQSYFIIQENLHAKSKPVN
jgi:hypothetical protein